nr:MAG TPA: hypothetical protein [Caudoviricetes sp.]
MQYKDTIFFLNKQAFGLLIRELSYLFLCLLLFRSECAK